MYHSTEELRKLLTPDQQQFLRLLRTHTFQQAADQMNVPPDELSKWLSETSFNTFHREIQNNIYTITCHEVMIEAMKMLQEMQNLREHLTAEERSDTLASVLRLLAKLKEERLSTNTFEQSRNYIDACKWRDHIDELYPDDDDDDDDDDEEDEEDDDTNHSRSSNQGTWGRRGDPAIAYQEWLAQRATSEQQPPLSACGLSAEASAKAERRPGGEVCTIPSETPAANPQSDEPTDGIILGSSPSDSYKRITG